MKRVLYILIITIAFASCVSSTKMLQRGQYDAAINKSVSKLMSDPSNAKELNVLNQSYKLANQKDKDRIDQLQLSGQPDRWDNIFASYNAMSSRQEVVSRLPQTILTSIGYKYVNYNNAIAEAKNKAADYYYIHSKTLLDKKDKYSARQAYDELQRVKSYFPNYKDVDALINQAYEAGVSYVLFKMMNNSQFFLPVDFERDLLKTSLANLNQKWLVFHSQPIKEFYYDYSIIVNIKVIDISPESQNQSNFTETREVQDGYQYKLDANGNVIKDANGNDIKIPKFVTHYCTITEVKQYKSTVITGTIDFWENQSKQIIKTEPIRAEFVFKNFSATATGDVNVLTPESRKKLDSQYLHFPENGNMIMSTGNILKGMVKDIIRRNLYLLN